ncbi:MAG: DUF1848 domain-containing protein [Spirochaetes bacterium]|nr:DUF1848 domain-containing protein [Spirochaetota bacterium]
MSDLKEEHPLIISASRRTDLPAWHSDWLLDIFKKQKVVWKNPFNPTYKKKICFDNTRIVVFWSKYPEPLINKLDFFDKKEIRYYFQFTLNDYPVELEMDLPSLSTRIDCLKKLVDRIGKGRVVWRFDPIILTDKINPDYIFNSIRSIGDQVQGYVERLMISFICFYPKVKKRLHKAGIQYKENTDENKLELYKKIGKIGKDLGIQVMSCADPLNINNELAGKNIEKGRCVDALLIKKMFSDDQDFIEKLDLLKKDKGQRKECGCIQSVDIGSYNTCRHHCMYCYANSKNY